MARILFGLALALCGGSASALDWETLSQDGQWRVDLNMYEDGSLDCEARTENGKLVFSLYEKQDGAFVIMFHSSEWSFPSGDTPTSFVVRVDYDLPWNMDGTRALGSIFVSPDRSGEDLHRFLGELRNGRHVTLGNAGGVELGTFSLTGSSASLDVLEECASRIRVAPSSDPFAAAPASARGDPFR